MKHLISSKDDTACEQEEGVDTHDEDSFEDSNRIRAFLDSLTEQQKHRLIRAVEITMGVIAVILIVGCIFLLFSDGATVKVRVMCSDWTASASKTEIAIYNYDAKDLLVDDDPSNDPQPKIVSRIQPNEDKVINDIISSGTYTLAVYTTPVLEDGTTFKTPEPQVVEFNGEDVVVEFNLDRE